MMFTFIFSAACLISNADLHSAEIELRHFDDRQQIQMFEASNKTWKEEIEKIGKRQFKS